LQDFPVYNGQIPIIEQQIETAAIMLRTDKSRGYCLDMIGADLLAATNLESGNSKILLHSIPQFFKFLTGEQSSHEHIRGVIGQIRPKRNRACDWIPNCTSTSVERRRSEDLLQPLVGSHEKTICNIAATRGGGYGHVRSDVQRLHLHHRRLLAEWQHKRR
jgi:hypothetical protein